VTSVREYDAMDGHLVRVFSPNGKAEFCKPRGLRFGPGGLLYCVARNEVVGLANAWGYRAIAAVKWTSLGVFPVVQRLLQSELVCNPEVGLYEVSLHR
jgi:hypothetical protein